jgi:recombination DNA repair RAD52 pathway protein
MSFNANQIRKLKASIRHQYIKQRELDGKTLNYLEGWYIISEANRIFGFDGWDRETISSHCVWQKQNNNGFSASYLTRV